MAIRPRCFALLLLSVLGTPLGGSVAGATETAAIGDSVYVIAEDAGLEERRLARAAELEAIRRSMEVSERRQAALCEEIQDLQTDQADLTAELIATAQRMRAAEEETAAVEVTPDDAACARGRACELR